MGIPSLPHRVDVVVVGGGVEGTSAAFHVARRRSRSVLLLEQGNLGEAETRASASMLAQQTGDAEFSKLARMAVEEYRTYGDEVGLQTTGSIAYTSDPTRVDDLRAQAAFQNEIGIPSQLLEDPTDIESFYPLGAGSGGQGSFVRAEGIAAAIYVSTDGFVDAHRVVQPRGVARDRDRRRDVSV